MRDLDKLYTAAAKEDPDMVLDSPEEYQDCETGTLLDDLVIYAARGDCPETVEFLQALVLGRCSY